MPKVETFIRKYFPDADLIGSEYHCRCPAHEDYKASLHITQGEEPDGNGSTKILMHCKAGCTNGSILKALGASWSAISGRNQLESIRKKIKRHYREDQYLSDAEVTDIYDYKDPEGKYLYSRIRFKHPDGSKDMRYACINYKTETISYSRGCDPVPYHLPELLKSIREGFPVYIVEGEKDVHTLTDQLYYVATTAGSASDWKREYAQYFRGASVIILPDNDKAGRDAVRKIQNDLLEYAYKVKTVYTSQQDHGDVTDFLEEGNTADDLKELIEGQEWQFAKWVTVEKKKQSINTDLLAGCISRNEKYLIVRLPNDNRDSVFTYTHGVYTRVNKNQFIADVIRPYIPEGRATSNMLDNTMKLLLTVGSHCVSYNDLDSDERYINVKNGLLNIDTWELEAHRPEVLSTIQLDVDYHPGSKRMKNFDRYINDLIRDPDGETDEEKAKVIQEYFGMILSNIPVYKLKKALFLVSFIGNTGKSSLLRLINSMLGEGRAAAIDLKDLDSGSGNRFMLGAMRGKRLIECGDQSSVSISDSSTFKRLTGGDLQKIEEKGVQGDYFVFTGGVVICSNQIPYFADDHGKHMVDRIQIIPLQHTIVNKDSNLEDLMIKEKNAVFNWFMEGLKRVRENGYKLTECGAVTEFMEEYRTGSDSLYRFVMEKYEITNNIKDRIQKSELDEAYHQWCGRINANPKEDRVTEVRKKNIKRRMISYGINVNENANIGDHRNVPCYVGIREKEDEG